MSENLSKEMQDKISFLPFIITEFAAAYKMNFQTAVVYLEKYGGLDFLLDNWWALHTENPFWAVRDIYEVCYHNGGMK
ncbi:hypothetical protein FACS18942_06480 [Planctomycetales bacterium]|nr:hypothetical protein FACS18942_06480 [Planctomycetales bacterium]GHT31372.1 hypothetical protein FACS1894214_2630 [Planctomycetales bacterium]